MASAHDESDPSVIEPEAPSGPFVSVREKRFEVITFSDVYTMATLLFAIVLFFAAISERFDYQRVRIALLSVAAVGLVAGIVVSFGQPITTG